MHPNQCSYSAIHQFIHQESCILNPYHQLTSSLTPHQSKPEPEPEPEHSPTPAHSATPHNDYPATN